MPVFATPSSRACGGYWFLPIILDSMAGRSFGVLVLGEFPFILDLLYKKECHFLSGYLLLVAINGVASF